MRGLSGARSMWCGVRRATYGPTAHGLNLVGGEGALIISVYGAPAPAKLDRRVFGHSDMVWSLPQTRCRDGIFFLAASEATLQAAKCILY